MKVKSKLDQWECYSVLPPQLCSLPAAVRPFWKQQNFRRGGCFLYEDEKEELVRVNLDTGEMITVASDENYRLDDLMNSDISTASETDILEIARC